MSRTWRLTFSLALLSLLGACTATQSQKSAARSHGTPAGAAPGAAPSLKPVGCVDIPSLSPEDTPAQILPGMRQCLDSHDYARAARLFLVADTYGRFDSLRVVDPTAGEVIPALESAYLESADRDSKARLLATAKEISASPRELLSLCSQVRALGPPTYDPLYMTTHGLSAFKGKSAGVKRDFQRNPAWESALKSVLACPGREGR